MSLTLTANNLAISPGLDSSFVATGGSSPYIYSVMPGGAGGSIGSISGIYSPPSTIGDTPQSYRDTIVVVDDASASTSLSILIGDPLILFCDILQTELGLDNGRVFIWDQKIKSPNDSGLYIAVAVIDCKPFANTNKILDNGDSEQSVNMMATLQLDLISRGPTARTRKEEVILALNSSYSQSQQEKNSFYIGKLPPGSRFVNLSQEDGAAIPYRFTISVAMQYFVKKVKAALYFDDIQDVEIDTDPSPNVI